MLTAGCPAAETFDKRAVIITQYLGAGAKSTEKDIKHSLSWWGISKIGMFTGALSSNIIWDKLSENDAKTYRKTITELAARFSKINYAKPARTIAKTKIKLGFCRLMQKKLYKNNSEYTDAICWVGLAKTALGREQKKRQADKTIF